MDYQTYCDTAESASKLSEAGDQHGAIAILQGLLESDISDLDKAIMAMNIAIICDKLEDTEAALAWYDHGIAYEELLLRHNIAEHKAAFLAGKNRDSESLALYEQLLTYPAMSEGEKLRITNNINVLRARMTGS